MSGSSDIDKVDIGKYLNAYGWMVEIVQHHPDNLKWCWESSEHGFFSDVGGHISGHYEYDLVIPRTNADPTTARTDDPSPHDQDLPHDAIPPPQRPLPAE